MASSFSLTCFAMGLTACFLHFAYGQQIKSNESHWALLVAGSNGYSNYRHQADICHAYHVIRNHGIPEDHIIVMMYDDIAHNFENPVQGNIINEPDGPNVYKGVKIDYSGDDVTPGVFLKVLTGDEEGISKLIGRKGRVVKSGPNDHVFVNFADHGAPGLLAFPNEVLNAKDLIDAIESMYNNQQYKEMVFYVEACESGSMFSKLLREDINVFATTAANPDESSFACYYDEKRGTYLGDVYSVNWMQDSDEENLSKETLQQQYRIVKKETNTSHVMEYGDLSISKSTLAEFQGNKTISSLFFRPMRKARPSPLKDAVPSENVSMNILERKLASSFGDEKIKHRSALEELKKRKYLTELFFQNIVSVTDSIHSYTNLLKAPLQMNNFKCYSKSVQLVRDMCPGLNLIQNDYALRNLRVMANMCETAVPDYRIWTAIGKVSFETSICSQL